MGVMADKLENVRIRASSPDGRITCVFHPDGGMDVDFQGDSYHHYRERELAHQLTALVNQCWASYMRYRDVAFTEVTGLPAVKEEPWRAEQRRLRAERAETVAEGVSTEENVYMRHVGVENWQVVIRDGALSTIEEEDFTSEIASGYRATMGDYHGKVAQLRKKHARR